MVIDLTWFLQFAKWGDIITVGYYLGPVTPSRDDGNPLTKTAAITSVVSLDCQQTINRLILLKTKQSFFISLIPNDKCSIFAIN